MLQQFFITRLMSLLSYALFGLVFIGEWVWVQDECYNLFLKRIAMSKKLCDLSSYCWDALSSQKQLKTIVRRRILTCAPTSRSSRLCTTT